MTRKSQNFNFLCRSWFFWNVGICESICGLCKNDTSICLRHPCRHPGESFSTVCALHNFTPQTYSRLGGLPSWKGYIQPLDIAMVGLCSLWKGTIGWYRSEKPKMVQPVHILLWVIQFAEKSTSLLPRVLQDLTKLGKPAISLIYRKLAAWFYGLLIYERMESLFLMIAELSRSAVWQICCRPVFVLSLSSGLHCGMLSKFLWPASRFHFLNICC